MYRMLIRRTLGVATMLTLVIASLGAQVRVRGYVRKDGTYVQPHTRSAPDGNPYNNYGFPGNYNPNTGEISKGDPLTYLQRYYGRTRVTLPSAPATRGPRGTVRGSGTEWSAPDIDALPRFHEEMPMAEVARSQRYCSWLYEAAPPARERCVSAQLRTLSSLLAPDYSSLPPDEFARSGRYCEWLYDDNRAGFYNCLNSQILGLSRAPATLEGVPSDEATRARRYCEWLYGDNRSGYQSCMTSQERGLSRSIPDGSSIPPGEWARAVKYCEWLYSDNRAGAAGCLVSQDRGIRAAVANGTLPTPANPEASRYCEWLYNDNRSGYWSCIRSRR